MVTRSRTQLSDTGSPHVRSARMNGAWLILNVRRETFSYPRHVNVIATIEEGALPETAIHEKVTLETDQKKRIVRFELSTTDGVQITPVLPVPETNSGPSLDGQLPDNLELTVTIVDLKTDREYDAVSIDIVGTNEGCTVEAIHD